MFLKTSNTSKENKTPERMHKTAFTTWEKEIIYWTWILKFEGKKEPHFILFSSFPVSLMLNSVEEKFTIF